MTGSGPRPDRDERMGKTRSLSRIPFDPREVHVVSGLSRWMGLLGRFQIVAAVFIFVVLLAVTGIVTTVEVIDPAASSAGEEPLVSVGEVSREAIGAVVAGVVLFSLLFLRGGMLLLSASDDLDTVVNTDALDQHHLEGALRRLKSYFVLESLLMVAISVGLYYATAAGWGL